ATGFIVILREQGSQIEFFQRLGLDKWNDAIALGVDVPSEFVEIGVFTGRSGQPALPAFAAKARGTATASRAAFGLIDARRLFLQPRRDLVDALIDRGLLLKFLFEGRDLSFEARNFLIALGQFAGGEVGESVAENFDPALVSGGDLREAFLDPAFPCSRRAI